MKMWLSQYGPERLMRTLNKPNNFNFRWRFITKSHYIILIWKQHKLSLPVKWAGHQHTMGALMNWYIVTTAAKFTKIRVVNLLLSLSQNSSFRFHDNSSRIFLKSSILSSSSSAMSAWLSGQGLSIKQKL